MSGSFVIKQGVYQTKNGRTRNKLSLVNMIKPAMFYVGFPVWMILDWANIAWQPADLFQIHGLRVSLQCQRERRNGMEISVRDEREGKGEVREERERSGGARENEREKKANEL